ncbi:MAG: hypothetical protein ACXWUG_20000 [Polyangiales bacterium]
MSSPKDRILALLSLLMAGCSANVEEQSTIPPGSCNQVPDPSNDVGMTVVVGARPDATGGTIVPGSYETVDRFSYVPKASTDTYAHASDRYRVVVDSAGKGHIEVADRVSGESTIVRETWAFSTTGTALAYTKSCPANGDAIDFAYTASPTEIRFFKPPSGTGGFVFVLRRTGD